MHFDRLYVADQSHPSFEGSYLIACVFVAVLTGGSPLGLPAPNRDTPAGSAVCDRAEAWANRGGGAATCTLTADEAAYLQSVAHTAVYGAAPRQEGSGAGVVDAAAFAEPPWWQEVRAKTRPAPELLVDWVTAEQQARPHFLVRRPELWQFETRALRCVCD